MQEKIVNPHLKHDFDTVCNVKLELEDTSVETAESRSFFCKFWHFLRRILFRKGSNPSTKYKNTEL